MTTLDPDRKIEIPGYVQTHVSIVVDRSGSMQGCWAEMVGAINAWLKDARADENLKESDVELTVFDSQSIDTLRKGAPLNMADLNPGEALPRASTPLYDAIGRGLDSLDGRLKSSGSFKAILVIVTDGAENASKKYRFDQIQEMIKGRQAAGWTVLFLGAGLEAAQQGMALGIGLANTASIQMDSASLGAVSRALYSASSGAAATQDFSEAQAYSASPKFSGALRQAMGDKTAGAGLTGRPFMKGTTLDQLNKTINATDYSALKAALTRKPVKQVDKDVAKDTWGGGDPDAWGE